MANSVAAKSEPVRFVASAALECCAVPHEPCLRREPRRNALAPDEPAAERRHPLRFVWQMDADGRFVVGSDEFIELTGPRTTAAFGRLWSEIAAELKLDPEHQVARAVATRETWSGITVSWPVDDGGERLPVELSGLPVFDRERDFRGYRGFGVCRDIARINQLARARRERPIGFMARPEAPQAELRSQRRSAAAAGRARYEAAEASPSRAPATSTPQRSNARVARRRGAACLAPQPACAESCRGRQRRAVSLRNGARTEGAQPQSRGAQGVPRAGARTNGALARRAEASAAESGSGCAAGRTAGLRDRIAEFRRAADLAPASTPDRAGGPNPSGGKRHASRSSRRCSTAFRSAC